MDLIRKYYSNCLLACTPEKYVIDQSEIEFSTTGKSSLRLKVIDWYYTTAGSFSVKKGKARNIGASQNDKEENLRKLSRKRTRYEHFDRIRVMDNLLLVSDQEGDQQREEGECHKRGQLNTCEHANTNDSTLNCLNGTNPHNRPQPIHVENTFDFALLPELGTPLNGTHLFVKTRKKVTHKKRSKKKKKVS
ncbi:conserved Plasmodium protein, unknown function [Plasmodium knowlesi strain H]|uniref:Uncharacterized protein n=3 Tax=Plasmodium knowlesi TaxID=5850 RepID=A0A5K1TW69_PLAKH|nr:conserved Plasmodium protein, unknown function [Plasmodium knowlesi strain H]OTN64586.1 Uncharacterized protein PKNOH_S130177900 [Plasmodium knowlesi]CAA9988947.1 conserved Plasmodium protein, unknown function [Plasmodium knowlesi strain H]SBO24791.1 conserved Plasmodium protein, unknown function [Plasmodium knowlesi strain H]VVS78421.1 conserved Plasmodium protein, unknown function [Plasmodium knowlesi strain H]|eukprot:XP_002261295.1 hypothetical protein, conserved in Plasmodium species [Plasmodium knowlesi strain H]